MMFDDDLPDEEEGYEGDPLDDRDLGPRLALHHHIPITLGGREELILLSSQLPSIHQERARRPVSPGMPPIWMPAPFQPESLRLIAPPGTSTIFAPLDTARSQTSPRLPFPLIPSPDATPSQPKPDLPSVAEPAAPPTPTTAPTAIPRPALRDRFDPLVGLLFFIALGVGTATLRMDVHTRYVLLWTVLIGMGALTLIDMLPTYEMASTNMLWGAVGGLILGLPLSILVREGLAATTIALLPDASPALIFQCFVLIAPLGETLFFRGILQEDRGFVASIIGVAVYNLILYWPATIATPPFLIAAVFFYTMMAGIYSYVRARYGLTAAFVCQATSNLLLIFLPALIASFNIAPRIP